MQLSDNQVDERSLASFGAEAAGLLYSGDFSSLANRFGYALAFGREPTTAIREDLESCLAQVQSVHLMPATRTAKVKYHGQGSVELVAVVECYVPTDSAAELLLELVVTSKGADKHLSLEQLSVVA